MQRQVSFKERAGPIISLTFDDGWQNQYDFALPILNRYGLTASFFIITEHLMKPTSRYMNFSHVLDLEREKHEIGAHSVTHPDFVSANGQVLSEIRKSKADIESLGISVQSFAYPYGSYNSQVLSCVREAGFANARTIRKGVNKPSINPFEIRGVSVGKDLTIVDVINWLTMVETEKAWLVLVFHDVQISPKQYGTTPMLLNEICAAIVTRDICCVPLGKVLM